MDESTNHGLVILRCVVLILLAVALPGVRGARRRAGAAPVAGALPAVWPR